MKRHLTKPKKDGPRCPGLKKVIPPDVWVNDILPYYSSVTKKSNLSIYKKQKSGSLRKPLNRIRRDKRTDRLVVDGLVDKSGECKFKVSELLHMLWVMSDKDGKWLIRQWEKLGPKKIRQKLSISTPPPQKQISAREALRLKIYANSSKRGYQLYRNVCKSILPSNKLVIAEEARCLPNYIRSDSNGAYVQPMELIRHTTNDILDMVSIQSEYVVIERFDKST